jgi:hypothetical protein
MKSSKSFNPYGKPYWYAKKPEKQIITKKVKYKSGKIYDGDIVYNEKGEPLTVSIESADYEDEPDEVYLYQFEEIVQENPEYEKQLKQYNEKRKKHKQELKDWQEQKKIYEKQLADEKEQYERKLLEQLKEKYDK